jgi:hypothetical protein
MFQSSQKKLVLFLTCAFALASSSLAGCGKDSSESNTRTSDPDRALGGSKSIHQKLSGDPDGVGEQDKNTGPRNQPTLVSVPLNPTRVVRPPGASRFPPGTPVQWRDTPQTDRFVRERLKLTPLLLPVEDSLPDEEARSELTSPWSITVSVPDGKNGAGQAVLAVDMKRRRVLYMAVSDSLVRRGVKRTAIIDAGLHMYSHCWDKPTMLGVGGCVAETFIDWIFAQFG